MIGKNTKIFVAGHRGFVGSSVVRTLRAEGFQNLCFCSRARLDLEDRKKTLEYFDRARPRVVVMCAAARKCDDSWVDPLEMFGEMGMVCNVLDGAQSIDVEKCVFVGGSDLYPKSAKDPCQESTLLSDSDMPRTSDLHLGRLMGIRQCEALWRQSGRFVSLISTELYGPAKGGATGGNQGIVSLILKLLLAKERGDGRVELSREPLFKTELLFVDDFAAACVAVLLEELEWPILNVGSGEGVQMEDFVATIASAVGFPGRIEWTGKETRSDKIRRLDCNRIRSLGWSPQVSLQEGVAHTVRDLQNRLNWSRKLRLTKHRVQDLSDALAALGSSEVCKG